eukprot:gene17159-26332_t
MRRRKPSKRGFATDMEARREVSLVYWKEEGDFKDVKEYNDYLEHIEDAVEALLSGVEAEQEAAWQAMEEYKTLHPMRTDRAFAVDGTAGRAAGRQRTLVARKVPALPRKELAHRVSPGAWQQWASEDHSRRVEQLQVRAGARLQRLPGPAPTHSAGLTSLVPPLEAQAAGYRNRPCWSYARAL